jgi:cyclopropane fatty-acyl-phospholipid synthase-like methyltransferase
MRISWFLFGGACVCGWSTRPESHSGLKQNSESGVLPDVLFDRAQSRSKETHAVTTSSSNTHHHPRYPRSNNYDPQWVIENQMGPHPLWLVEALSEVVQFKPGMRVLDLGCGTALTSIFLAKEFGIQVWATDLWIEASANVQRIRAAGVEDLVIPIHAEAHALPFAEDFFDVIVSVDAYHYFGTDDLYLGYLAPFLKKEGQIAIAVPGLVS